jgi:hypothetical protein
MSSTGSRGNILVSDTERNRVIEMLKQHTADGRLTLDEFEDRVAETLAARRGGELQKVLRDLPPLETDGVRARRSLSLAAPPMRLPAVALVLIVVWFAAGHVWWPLFVFGMFWFCARGRRQHHARGWHEAGYVDSDDVTTLV